jgi:hypothetical protein
MAQTVKIDPETHALLSRLAADDGVSLQEELARSVRARRKEQFFQQMAAGYAQMTDAERAEDAEEAVLWDRSLADGIDAQ